MERKVGYELREVQQLLHRKKEMHRSQHQTDLTHLQVRVLLHVYKSKVQVFQKDIESYLKIRRSTATEMLKILERDGYIERIRLEADARMKVIHITDKTRFLIDKMDQHLQEIETTLIQKIPEQDLKTFFSVIDQIKDNLK